VEDGRPRPREVEDELWNRFKAAQDVFFQARSAAFSEQDEELRGNQKVKEEILAEAEQIDPAAGLDKAKSQLRRLQDRWEAAGKVPRDAMRPLEARMAAVEEKVREADGARFAKAEESPFLVRLREKVAELEVKLDKARAAGRPTEELEAPSPRRSSGWPSPAAAPRRRRRPPRASRRRTSAAPPPGSAPTPRSPPVSQLSVLRRNSTVRLQASCACSAS
jgi:hypothetical protein